MFRQRSLCSWWIFVLKVVKILPSGNKICDLAGLIFTILLMLTLYTAKTIIFYSEVCPSYYNESTNSSDIGFNNTEGLMEGLMNDIGKIGVALSPSLRTLLILPCLTYAGHMYTGPLNERYLPLPANYKLLLFAISSYFFFAILVKALSEGNMCVEVTSTIVDCSIFGVFTTSISITGTFVAHFMAWENKTKGRNLSILDLATYLKEEYQEIKKAVSPLLFTIFTLEMIYIVSMLYAITQGGEFVFQYLWAVVVSFLCLFYITLILEKCHENFRGQITEIR